MGKEKRQQSFNICGLKNNEHIDIFFAKSHKNFPQQQLQSDIIIYSTGISYVLYEYPSSQT